jgi:rubrerythrin
MFEYLAMQEKIHENKLKLLLKKLHRELESEKTKLEKN